MRNSPPYLWMLLVMSFQFPAHLLAQGSQGFTSTGPTVPGMAADIQNNAEMAKEYIKGAIKLPDADAVTLLKAALLPGGDRDNRKLAIETAYMAKPVVAERILGEIMAGDNLDEKTDILKNIGKVPPNTQYTLLLRAFDDRAQRIKDAALKATVKLPSKQKVELFRSLSNNPDPIFRAKIVEESGNLDRAGAYNVTEAFRTDKDPRVKAAVAKVRTKHKIEE